MAKSHKIDKTRCFTSNNIFRDIFCKYFKTDDFLRVSPFHKIHDIHVHNLYTDITFIENDSTIDCTCASRRVKNPYKIVFLWTLQPSTTYSSHYPSTTHSSYYRSTTYSSYIMNLKRIFRDFTQARKSIPTLVHSSFEYIMRVTRNIMKFH